MKLRQTQQKKLVETHHNLCHKMCLTPAIETGILIRVGRDRRGRALRTPSGPRGSSGKEVSLGVAGKPAQHFVNEE